MSELGFLFCLFGSFIWIVSSITHAFRFSMLLNTNGPTPLGFSETEFDTLFGPLDTKLDPKTRKALLLSAFSKIAMCISGPIGWCFLAIRFCIVQLFVWIEILRARSNLTLKSLGD